MVETILDEVEQGLQVSSLAHRSGDLEQGNNLGEEVGKLVSTELCWAVRPDEWETAGAANEASPAEEAGHDTGLIAERCPDLTVTALDFGMNSHAFNSHAFDSTLVAERLGWAASFQLC